MSGLAWLGCEFKVCRQPVFSYFRIAVLDPTHLFEMRLFLHCSYQLFSQPRWDAKLHSKAFVKLFFAGFLFVLGIELSRSVVLEGGGARHDLDLFYNCKYVWQRSCRCNAFFVHCNYQVISRSRRGAKLHSKMFKFFSFVKL